MLATVPAGGLIDATSDPHVAVFQPGDAFDEVLDYLTHANRLVSRLPTTSYLAALSC